MVDSEKSFVSTYNGISNVLINEVYISKAFSPTQRIYQLTPDCKKYNAIWDTGATSTVITSKVAQDCGLICTGIAIIKSPGGTRYSNVYLVNLWLPNKMMIPNLRVIEGDIGGNEEILIGMDIINKGDFAVSNFNGKTVFSFRMPSLECTDYVKNPFKNKPIKVDKIGRNDPCPCGSGKKYKKCCGKND